MDRTIRITEQLIAVACATALPSSQGWIARATAWLKAQRTRSAAIDDLLFLERAFDQCDLEWRIRQIERRWAYSGFGIGGTRF